MKQGSQTLPVQVTSDGSTKTTESSSTTAQTTVASSTTGVKQRESQESEAQKVAEQTLQADASRGSSEVSRETQQSSQAVISSQTESGTTSSATQSSAGVVAGTEKVAEEGSQNKTIATQTSCNEQSEREEQQQQQLDKRGGRRSALPITKRGQFFNDSYFEDTWKYYQDAVRDVLEKWDDNSAAATDDMTCYRRLRSRDMRDENQAITSAEDSSSYKVSGHRLMTRESCCVVDTLVDHLFSSLMFICTFPTSVCAGRPRLC